MGGMMRWAIERAVLFNELKVYVHESNNSKLRPSDLPDGGCGGRGRQLFGRIGEGR